MSKPKELTARQERFCKEYQLTYYTDSAIAYRKAYKTPPSTSTTTTRVNASRLLKLPHIIDQISQLKKISRKRALVTLDNIITRLDASIKRSEKKGHEGTVQTGLMNLAAIQGQSKGETQTFSYKDSKTIQDTIDVLNEAQEDFSQNLISARQLAEVRSTQKQISDSLYQKKQDELEERLEALEEKQ